MSSQHPALSRSESGLPARLERKGTRLVQRSRMNAAVASARGTLKVAAVSDVAQSALMAQGNVALVASALVERTPTEQFASEAAYLTQTTAFTLGAVIIETGRSL